MWKIYVFCMFALRSVMSLTVTHLTWNSNVRVSTFTNTFQLRSALDCGTICSLDDDCWSLSFNDVTGVCLLSNIKVKILQDNWIADAEWQTLAKTGKTFRFIKIILSYTKHTAVLIKGLNKHVISMARGQGSQIQP